VSSVDRHPTRSIAPPDHCEECGFQASSVSIDNAVKTLRDLGGSYAELIAGHPDAVLRRRPDAQTWSALEYAAHMRDVIALWGGALHVTLTRDDPELPRPDSALADRTAAEGSYNTQDPSAVVSELSSNSDRMAKKAATIEGDGWARAVRLGEVRLSALDIVRKVAHEGQHHLLDVSRSIQAAGTQP
jgi:hypothetical protein